MTAVLFHCSFRQRTSWMRCSDPRLSHVFHRITLALCALLFTYIECVAYYNNRDLSQLDIQAIENAELGH